MELEQAIKQSAEDLGFHLKEKQQEAIVAFLQGQDTFVSLPTGYGKSAVYGVLPLIFDKLKGKKDN